MEIKKPSRNILWVWRIRLSLICIIPAILNGWFNTTMSTLWIIFTIIWVVFYLYFYLSYFKIKYKKISYGYDEKNIYTFGGVFYTISKAISFENIQFISTYSSPMEKYFGINTIRIIAPGGNIIIYGADKKECDFLSSMIKEHNNGV